MDSVALGPFRAFALNYFNQVDESLRTSKKRKFSKVIKSTTIVVEEVDDVLKQGRGQLLATLRSQFDQFRFELEMGFSLCFYGFGSKIELIEEFCIHNLPDCPIIIVDSLSYKFNAHEFGIQLKTHLAGFSPPKEMEDEALYSAICTDLSLASRKVALIFCGLDKVQPADLRLLSMITQQESLIFIGMIENPEFVAQSLDSCLQQRFSFVFHDMTTYVSYNYELGSIAEIANSEETKDEIPKRSLESVKYVLKSLPAKSLKLLKYILDSQLAGRTLGRGQAAKIALDNFIISSENGLMPLLNEFFDHHILRITEEDRLLVTLEEEELPKLRDLLP